MITVLSSVQRTYTHIPITMPIALGRYASSPSALCFFSLPIALGRYANIYTIHILTSSTVFFLTQSHRPTGLPCTTLEVKQKKIAYYSTDYCNKRCSLYLVLCPWQVYPKIKAKKREGFRPPSQSYFSSGLVALASCRTHSMYPFSTAGSYPSSLTLSA